MDCGEVVVRFSGCLTRREQQAEASERTRAGEKQVEREAHDDRGEPQERIERHDEDLPARKAVDGEGRSQRHSEQCGQSGGGKANGERERDDLPERSFVEDGPQIPVAHRSAEPGTAAIGEPRLPMFATSVQICEGSCGHSPAAGPPR